MAQYGTLITNIGLAQIANAQVTQSKVGLEYIAIGDGNGAHYVPTQNQTALVNEVWRGPITEASIDPQNDNRIIIDAVIPVTAGGFTIREIGIFDDQNQLIAVGQYPEKYKPELSEGVSEETVIHFVIETNNADVVKLSIDPTIIIASRSYVDGKMAAHTDPTKIAAHQIKNIEGLAQELTSLREGIGSEGTNLINHTNDTNKHLQAGERSNFHPKNTVPFVDGRSFIVNGEAKNLALLKPVQWGDFLRYQIGMGVFNCFVKTSDLGVGTNQVFGHLTVICPYTDLSGGSIIQVFEAYDGIFKRYQIDDNTWSSWVRLLDSGQNVVIDKGIPMIRLKPTVTPVDDDKHFDIFYNASGANNFGVTLSKDNQALLHLLGQKDIRFLGHDDAWTSLADLKSSVSNGKSLVANAITDMGVPTSPTAEFATMAGNIRAIRTGRREAKGSATAQVVGTTRRIIGSGIGFTPSIILISRVQSDVSILPWRAVYVGGNQFAPNAQKIDFYAYRNPNVVGQLVANPNALAYLSYGTFEMIVMDNVSGVDGGGTYSWIALE